MLVFSPLLFIIVLEALSRELREGVADGKAALMEEGYGIEGS